MHTSTKPPPYYIVRTKKKRRHLKLLVGKFSTNLNTSLKWILTPHMVLAIGPIQTPKHIISLIHF